MPMTDEEFGNSRAGEATTAIISTGKAVPTVRHNAMAWEEEEEEVKVLVTRADPSPIQR
jgi:hypothetical protein